MIAKVQSLKHVEAIELGTGGWPGRDHLDDLDRHDRGAVPCVATYRQMIDDAGLTDQRALLPQQSAASGSGTSPARRTSCSGRRCVSRRKMQVPTVVTFSGCPGDSDTARHIPTGSRRRGRRSSSTCSIGSGKQKAIPVLDERRPVRCRSRRERSPSSRTPDSSSTTSRHAAEASRGRRIPPSAINFDPSHLFWQGVEIPSAIARAR